MKKLILFLPLFALLISCKKEVTELPAATQTGANTFGAKVDGSFFVPQGFGGLPANDILEARWIGNDFLVIARNFSSSPNEKEMEIFLKNAKNGGTFTLNTTLSYPTTAASYGYYVKRNVNPEFEWMTSATTTGTVTLTRVDTVQRIVSGTFSFSGKELFGAAADITVTEGRFDIRIP
jgi:hypothetical protein